MDHNIKIQQNGRVDVNSFLKKTSRRRAHKHFSKDRLSRPQAAETTNSCVIHQPQISAEPAHSQSAEFQHKSWYWINDNNELKLAYLIQALRPKKTIVNSVKKGSREKMCVTIENST